MASVASIYNDTLSLDCQNLLVVALATGLEGSDLNGSRNCLPTQLSSVALYVVCTEPARYIVYLYP